MQNRVLFILILILYTFSSGTPIQAQLFKKWNERSIENRLDKMQKRLAERPIEVGAVVNIKDGHIYLNTNDIKWLRRAMRPVKSGLTVQIQSKPEKPCLFSENEENVLKNTVLDNVYFRTLRKKSKHLEQGGYGMYYIADLPIELYGLQNQFKVMFTIKEHGRAYWTYIHPWGYRSSFDEIYEADQKGRMSKYLSTFKYKPSIKNDTIVAKIPFDVYSDEVNWRIIKDSAVNRMGLVTSIDSTVIKAYASVDGEQTNNLQLAQQRGQNIVRFLRDYNIDTSKINLSANENWLLFEKQYKKENISFFKRLSHDEIKEFFSDTVSRNQWTKELEEQRTAHVEMFCSTLHPVLLMDNQELLPRLKVALENNERERAEMLLYEIWSRVISGKLISDELKDIYIPESKKNKGLKDKHSWMLHLQFGETQNCTLYEIQQLLAIRPRDPELNYWLLYKKFKNDEVFWDLQSQKAFERATKSLRRYKVPNYYINRLLMSFYQQAAYLANLESNYKLKAYYMKSIYNLARRHYTELSEITDISAFCSMMYYSKMGRKLIEPYIRKNQYDKKMLEAFVWMTLYKVSYYSNSEYQTLVEAFAINNPDEFKKMFEVYEKGGIAFFLLDHSFYRELYCKCAKSTHSNITKLNWY